MLLPLNEYSLHHKLTNTYLLASCVPSHVRHPPRNRQPCIGQLNEVLLNVAGHLLRCPRAHGLGYLLVSLSLHSLGRVDLEQLLKLRLQCNKKDFSYHGKFLEEGEHQSIGTL